MAWTPPRSGDCRTVVRFERRSAIDKQGNRRGPFATLIEQRICQLVPNKGGEITVGDRLAGRSVFDLGIMNDNETIAVTNGDRVVDITNADAPRYFEVKWAEAFDDRRQWILMQVEATTGEDGR